ncbi:PilX N-terminal domain-containing pilus assembly protein [Marinobacter sp. ATCH36]|uniref:PilX N-terminal domain-containing pilus assembly protein n=1 Tax=Marinobacter sp. ATCH36 TaxID=2945106 RepID=UPI002021C62E|nr:PilX N-terminal domain-containing pilus assembly protein [Marinobacter sp. ATCH36]MCL7945876.1 PilX N-terminal domain-containing pilus assembly protein [Marinobacter sp. ATCH36]
MLYRQKGAALLMSLVILLVLSLLATSSMQNSIMQERMSTSTREGLMALEAAEAALREVEEQLEGLDSLDNFGSDTGSGNDDGWFHTGFAPAVFDDSTWGSGTKSLEASEIDGITPRYFIEYRGPVELTRAGQGGDGEYLLNLNFEGKGNRDGGGGTAGPGGSDILGKAESMRIVVMAEGPSEQSRKIIEAYYFVSAKNMQSGG